MIDRMSMIKFFARGKVLLCVALLALCACSPKLDWRDYRAPGDAYTVLMPAKPAVHERAVTLNGMKLNMRMSAVDISGVTFAVGVITLPDASLAMTTLGAMKEALLKNIGSTLTSEKTKASPENGSISIYVDAIGAPSESTKGKPRLLFGRFVAKGPQVFQVLVTGPQDEVSNDAVDTFLTSFKAK